MKLTSAEFKRMILPGLRAEAKDNDDLIKRCKEFAAANEVVDDEGNPVEFDFGLSTFSETKSDKAAAVAVAPTPQQVEAEVTKQLAAERAKLAQTVSKGTQTMRVEYLPAEPKKEDNNWGWKSMGEFTSAVYSFGTGKGVDDRLTKAPTGAHMSQGVDGGFLVPPSFSQTIWDGLNASPDNLLARTDSYSVTGESLTFNANAETSRVDGSRYGGIRGYWIAEADQITSSRPKWRQIKLEPKQLAVLVYATDKLLNNATALEQYITRAATDEIQFKVGDAIINGTGAGQPLGILNASCVVSVAKETGQAAATILFQNVIKMWARLHPKARSRAAWYYNVACEPQLAQMSIGVGTAGQPVYLPPGGLSASPYATLLGRPMIPIEYAAALGTAGDLVLADLGFYASGTRNGLNSAMSMHLKFDYAETALRFIFEVDGQPWLASALTPYKGADTLSPFVTLATRA